MTYKGISRGRRKHKIFSTVGEQLRICTTHADPLQLFINLLRYTINYSFVISAKSGIWLEQKRGVVQNGLIVEHSGGTCIVLHDKLVSQHSLLRTLAPSPSSDIRPSYICYKLSPWHNLQNIIMKHCTLIQVYYIKNSEFHYMHVICVYIAIHHFYIIH